MNPTVDFYFDKPGQWQMAYKKLRSILLDCAPPLMEELKWGCPCYTYEGKNVVLIHGFKDYCALLFFKGALLHDGEKLLIRQTENVQSSRQIRFTNLKEIEKLEKSIKAYVSEAIAAEKIGLKVSPKERVEKEMPLELTVALKNTAGLKQAFEQLTPGRQRAYLLFFTAPKQAKTREARITKSIPRILEGKGLNDD